jgi:hypothetical protein
LAGAVHRLVESQEQVATNALVRTLAEQALLEELLETSKPPLPAAAAGLHYLLATPFRYPPLRFGSRFGRRFEPSLFYAARSDDTALAEGAYYRFVFWSGMAVPPPAPLQTRHTMFTVAIHAEPGLQLQAPPFDAYAETLAHRSDYAATQALGTALRQAGFEALEYVSARDPARGINVALFTPVVIAARRPERESEWLCETHAALVRFYNREVNRLLEFPLDTFTVDGSLPTPAT